MAKDFVHLELLNGVRELIVDGSLPEGHKVPEGMLCERFGVSRTPLREVLKVLASEGHVELLPNRGARVRQLSVEEVQGLFDVTGALESLAGEQCCLRITDARAAEIAELHEQMSGSYRRGDLDHYYGLNRSIHEAIIQSTGNPVLQGLYGQVNARIRRVRFATPMTPRIWSRAMAEHEGMLNAIARRDGASLGGILKTHLGHKSQAIVAMMLSQSMAKSSGLSPG